MFKTTIYNDGLLINKIEFIIINLYESPNFIALVIKVTDTCLNATQVVSLPQ